MKHDTSVAAKFIEWFRLAGKTKPPPCPCMVVANCNCQATTIFYKNRNSSYDYYYGDSVGIPSCAHHLGAE